MADNPNKKKADGKRISQQPHEQAYQRKKAAKKATKSKPQEKRKITVSIRSVSFFHTYRI